MNITYTWAVTSMSAVPQIGSDSDVVITASWICTGSTDATPPVQSFFQGLTDTPFTGEGSFTPYADLTQDQVLGWVWANGVSKSAVEAQVATNIDMMINPPVVVLPLPWATPAA